MTIDKPLPVVVDTTLRDGIQMPGVDLCSDAKMAIIGALADLGVEEAEIGFAAQGAAALEEMRMLARHVPNVNCSVWCRARCEDLDAASRAGVSTIHISFPVSDRHLRIVGWSREMALERADTLIGRARARARFVTAGAQDATRADPHFLSDFVAAATNAGAHRVRIADTVGIATPRSAASLVELLNRTVPGAALEYHGHNDFGLATASTLAVMEHGIEAISVTVLGVGERAGNAALEEVVTAAVMLYSFKSRMRLARLGRLCEIVGEKFGLQPRSSKAISGVNSFRHESGIHCHGMLRDPLAYQPFAPEAVGRNTVYSVGSQSGASSLLAVGRNQGTMIART